MIGLAPREIEWAEAIAAGSPPFERLRHQAFRSGPGDRGAKEAAARWLHTACAGSRTLEAMLLDALELDGLDLVRAFAPARIQPGQCLPQWAECLIETVRALPEQPTPAVLGEDPTTAAARTLPHAAARLLDWDRLTIRYPVLDGSLLPRLTRQLATRMLLACGATLELETTTQTDPVWDFSRSAWMDRLCGFTGLNYVVGTAIRQWKQNTLETLTRVGQDIRILKERLLIGATEQSVIHIESDLGDRHNDGRSVAVLRFSGGTSVVYKPKDLRCAARFMELLAHLNATSGSRLFHTREILCCGSYGWERFVEERTASTEAEAAIYFHRYGALLRVLQIVEGRDFWLDNLRISGDLPVFIDLECILHPRLKCARSAAPIMGLEPELYEESVLPTAAVTHTVEIPGAEQQNFGGLASPGTRLLPLGAWTGWRDRRNGNIWLHQGRIYWEPQLAWPQVGGVPTNPVDYLEQLERGYRKAQGLLQRCAPGLLSSGGPATGISEVPVRALMRSTWEYLVLLRASLEPAALLHGNARELALAHVFADSPEGGAENHAVRFAIARRECDAIRVLDIPEFNNLPSSSFLLDTSGCAVASIFECCAFDRFERRLTEVASFDITRHARILRDAVNAIQRPGLPRVAVAD
jgi:hypothetical protein